MFISGRPHPAFTGKIVSIGFLGDSINIATGDFGRVTPDDPLPARGWNGRACGGEPPMSFWARRFQCGRVHGCSKTALFRYLFGVEAGEARVTCLVDGYGINNLRQQTKTRAPDAVWRDGLVVADIAHAWVCHVQTTLTPMSDSWLIFDPQMGQRNARFAAFRGAKRAQRTGPQWQPGDPGLCRLYRLGAGRGVGPRRRR